MTKPYPVTVHCLVKNEDRFVGYALLSVLPYVEQVLVYDTGSTDQTVAVVKALKDKKIIFSEKGPVTANQLVELRREQIGKTTTEFFFLLDGDEVWPGNNLETFLAALRTSSPDKVAFFCRSRNAVGDIYHYLPENAGYYRLGGLTGHLNIRGYRNVPGISVVGTYPLEAYTLGGKALNDQADRLQFVDTWYLHASHLRRSTLVPNRKYKYELGIKMGLGEVPEVFSLAVPPAIPPPPLALTPGYLLQALWQTPLKHLKRKIVSSIT